MKPVLLSLLLATAAHAEPMSEAKSLFAQGKMNESKLLFQQAQTESSKAAEAHFYLGRIALRAGDFDAAIKQLETSVRIQPADADAHYYLGTANCQAAAQASIFRQIGLASDCKKYLLSALQLNPRQWDAREVLMQFYLQAPGIAGGGHDKAVDLAKETAALDPAHGEYLAALLAQQDKDFATARRHFEQATTLATDEPDYVYSLGLMQIAQQQYEDAWISLTRMVERFPNDPRAYYQQGRMAVLAKNKAWYQRGEQAFQHYFELPESDKSFALAWAWFRRGELYELMGRADEAHSAFVNAAAAQPDARLQKELAKKN